jgi:hypothetical protein
LVTSDHNIWAAGTHLSKDTQYSVLLHYSTKTDSFEVVEDVDGLLRPNDSSVEKTIDWGKDRILKESPDGMVLFVLRGEIYSYNLTTNKAEEIFANSEMQVASIESDPRGFIWFTVTEDDRLWMLHPDSNQLKSFVLPDLYPGTDRLKGKYFRDGYTLYLDSHERLWVPAWGYLDTNNEEYKWQVLPAMPLFVNLYDLYYVYAWDKANTFETKDDSIWFTSMNGVIHYDMETGSTCWIAPETGPVAESPDGVLWILLKEQLYQYKP